MKRKRYSEEQIAFALRQHESGNCGGGDRQEDGDHRTDLLPLEEEVCWSGRRCSPQAEAAGRGEPEAQTTCG